MEQAKNSLLSTGGEQSNTQPRQLPFLHNGVSTLLIPDRVNTTSDTSPTHPDNQVLTQTVREFEGDNNDPFEMVQLQTIDDMAELQSVLQPNSTVAPTSTSQPTPYPPIATVAITSHDAPLVDLSDSRTDNIEVTTIYQLANNLLCEYFSVPVIPFIGFWYILAIRYIIS